MSTLGELVTEVSIIVGDKVVGEYYPATEIKRALGDAYRYYSMPLVMAGEGYFETTTNLTIVQNQEYISLASLTPSFWSVSVLWRKLSTGYQPLKKNEQRYKFISTIGIGAGDTYIPEYRHRGQNLILTPAPIAGDTDGLKMDYVYIPTFPNQLSADGFTFDANFPSIFELNIKLRTAIKLLESKDAVGGVSDINTMKSELADADAYFQSTLTVNENPEAVEYQGLDYNAILT
jgi:hypothetical protein